MTKRILPLCLAVAVGACESNGLPTLPDSVVATISGVSIQGLPPAITVGQTAPLTLRATYSDGRTEVVTARWSTRTLACLIDAAGLLTALAEGECTVEGAFEDARAASTFQIAPPQVFTVSGVVRERWGLREPPIPFAAVTVTTGSHAGRQVTADAAGRFEIAGLPNESIQVRSSAEGFDSNTRDASPAQPVVDFFLEPPLVIEERSFMQVPGATVPQITEIAFNVRYRTPLTVRVSSDRQQCEVSYTTVFSVSLRLSGAHQWGVSPCYGTFLAERTEILDPGSYTLTVYSSQWCCFNVPRNVYLRRPR